MSSRDHRHEPGPHLRGQMDEGIVPRRSVRGHMSDLFRKEAVAHATRRLSGAVVLATPLTVRVLGLFFCAIIFAGVAFASVATYARKATVTGWLVPDQGLIRAAATSAGFVERLVAAEGEVVERGGRIAEIR